MREKFKYQLLKQLTKKLNVLIIEDDNSIEENYYEYLQEMFKNVQYLDKESEILTYVNSQYPDIIFIDLQINNLKAFNLIKELRYLLPRQIFIATSTIINNTILLKCIDLQITKFLEKPIEFVKFKSSILTAIDNLLLNNPDKLNHDSLKSIHMQPVDTLLSLIENNHTSINLINHYKGVPIIRQSDIIEIVDNEIKLKVKDANRYTLEELKHGIISSQYLASDIYSELKSIDHKNNIAVFNNFTFINSYIHHRKNIRIIPDKNFIIILGLKTGNYKCNIINISEDFILIEMPNISKKLTINQKLDLYMNFDLINKHKINSFTKHTFKTLASVNEIIEIKDSTKVLLNFDLKEENKLFLQTYIYERSFSLIRELKEKFIAKVKKV